MSAGVDPAAVRTGRVRGRYFRENFAQGGLELVQMIPELVTNADAAIQASGRSHGRIRLAFGQPDPEFAADVAGADPPSACARATELVARAALQRRRNRRRRGDDRPASRRARSRPGRAGQRGLFGRGLGDVWLAQGAGRIEGVTGGRAVESWFFPPRGDDPYAFVHVRDEPAVPSDLEQLGAEVSGTRVTVPLAATQVPAPSRLRMLAGQLVQLRPILEDPLRELWLELPGEAAYLVSDPAPEPDPEGPVCSTMRSTSEARSRPRIVVRRPQQPIAAHAAARDPPRRAADPLRPRRARDHPGRPRGASRRTPPLRRGVVPGARGTAARRARLAAATGRREGRPLGAQRAPPVVAAPLRGDRAGDPARSSTPRSAVPERTDCSDPRCQRA